jgi:hypothetical protein
VVAVVELLFYVTQAHLQRLAELVELVGLALFTFTTKQKDKNGKFCNY